MAPQQGATKSSHWLAFAWMPVMIACLCQPQGSQQQRGTLAKDSAVGKDIPVHSAKNELNASSTLADDIFGPKED